MIRRKLWAWFDDEVLAQWHSWLSYPGPPLPPPPRLKVTGTFWEHDETSGVTWAQAGISGAMTRIDGVQGIVWER